MQGAGESKAPINISHENLACPACGLLCDDLGVEHNTATDTLKVTRNGCSKSIRFFEQPHVTASPRVLGRPATFEAAAARAAAILAQSNLPVFSGLGTEVLGTRAVMRLADSVGATLDHMHSASMLRNTLVIQNADWLVTTLTEVRNRVDLLLIIGTDIVSCNQRFFERYIWSQETMFGQDSSQRQVVYLGGRGLDTKPGISPDGVKPTVLECDVERLPEVVAALRALVAGKQLAVDAVAGVSVAELTQLAARLHAAKYSVVSWVGSALDFPHAELTVQNICSMIVTLNAGTRSAGLPLGGSEGDHSVQQASTWLSGYPPRNSFKRGFPEYDPYHFDSARLLASHEADSLLWISSFTPERLPPATTIPTIVLGHAAMKFQREPDVFIPVAIPGLDHHGTMFRVDSSVSLPLSGLRQSALPTLPAAIAAISSALHTEVQHAD